MPPQGEKIRSDSRKKGNGNGPLVKNRRACRVTSWGVENEVSKNKFLRIKFPELPTRHKSPKGKKNTFEGGHPSSSPKEGHIVKKKGDRKTKDLLKRLGLTSEILYKRERNVRSGKLQRDTIVSFRRWVFRGKMHLRGRVKLSSADERVHASLLSE